MQTDTQRLRNFEGSDALGNGDFSICRAAATEIEALRATLSRCRDQFCFYVTEHRAKGTPQAYAKAAVNIEMVDLISAALGDAK
jgi:hypothetical protein